MGNAFPEYKYRERCLREKGKECIVCGSTEDILVHHVDGKRSNNKIENLIPVCDQHHRDIHSKRENVAKWVKELGYEPRSELSKPVQISTETWTELNQKKQPGETFDDVIQRLLSDKSA